ncbi:potassium transporter Kef [Gammaproteobacteria bacterium 45_16_T64]|nr:potassium transporter Kef [Gammaproteobacteria bacterium 45_16_T64]
MPEPSTPTPTDISDDIWQDGAREPINNLKRALESRAGTQTPMNNFSLARADLQGVNLVNRGAKQGYSLTNSDLYRANLEKAHLFMIDLSGSSLMKANLVDANLHYANLDGCNLLGVNLKGAKVEHVNWGTHITQELQARKAEGLENRLDLYQQAEEIYRHLRQTAEYQGLFELAGHFFQKEMTMRRKQMPKISTSRCISKLVDIFCGYGERPLRVIMFSVSLIVLFATLYFFAGLSFSGESLGFDSSIGFWENVKVFLGALYFSVVTFTTLGYGDVAPVGGLARALAATEAFLGSFTLALFVVVFVKKMTR